MRAGVGQKHDVQNETQRVQAPSPITARRFISRGLQSHPDWHGGGPLFIDELDEVRVGDLDPRVPLDWILARIEALGTPPFRLSCGSRSWLEPGDHQEPCSLAGAADLAALTLDALLQLAERIRNGSISDWRQYWHRDPNSRKPLKPQHEDDCRNALLSDLNQMLQPYDVDAQAEGQYADAYTADIRVAGGSRLAIPIEIRMNSHRDIWHAVDEQLVAKYTQAPGSAG